MMSGSSRFRPVPTLEWWEYALLPFLTLTPPVSDRTDLAAGAE
jgi:hypothetical protein